MPASRDTPRARRPSDWFEPCCADRVVRPATETIPRFSANLHVPVHTRRRVATYAMQPAPYRPSVHPPRLMEPCAQRPHNRDLRELDRLIARLRERADQLRFSRQSRHLELPVLAPLISSTPASGSPGRQQAPLVLLVPCARAAFQST